MGQTVFLLFGADGRLVQSRVASTNDGSVEPAAMFYEGGMAPAGYTAVQVDPRVVEKIRPEVWLKVTGHGSIAVIGDEDELGVQIDELDRMRKTLLFSAIEAAEIGLIDAGASIARLRGAHEALGGLPGVGHRLVSESEAVVRRMRSMISELESGSREPEVDPILRGLAGKVLPL